MNDEFNKDDLIMEEEKTLQDHMRDKDYFYTLGKVEMFENIVYLLDSNISFVDNLKKIKEYGEKELEKLKSFINK